MTTDSPEPSASEMSLGAKLLNIFASPGEVFDAVKFQPVAFMNWLVPVTLSCLMGIIFSFVVFSQDAIVHQMREAQEKELQKQVAAGKMTQQQADKAMETMEKFMSPTMFKIFGSIGAVVGSFIMLFLGALIFWLIGTKALKGDFEFMKAVEVCGLANMINLLGGVVYLFLVLMKGSMTATPSPALFLPTFDPANTLHRLLAAINVIELWYVAVLGSALARLANVSYGKAAAWLFGLWMVLRLGLALINIGGVHA